MRILNCLFLAFVLSLQPYAYAESMAGHDHHAVQSADSQQHDATQDGEHCKRDDGCCCKCCKKDQASAEKSGKESCCKECCCCKCGKDSDKADSCHRKTSANSHYGYHSAFADYAADQSLTTQQ